MTMQRCTQSEIILATGLRSNLKSWRWRNRGDRSMSSCCLGCRVWAVRSTFRYFGITIAWLQIEFAMKYFFWLDTGVDSFLITYWGLWIISIILRSSWWGWYWGARWDERAVTGRIRICWIFCTLPFWTRSFFRCFLQYFVGEIRTLSFVYSCRPRKPLSNLCSRVKSFAWPLNMPVQQKSSAIHNSTPSSYR